MSGCLAKTWLGNKESRRSTREKFYSLPLVGSDSMLSHTSVPRRARFVVMFLSVLELLLSHTGKSISPALRSANRSPLLTGSYPFPFSPLSVSLSSVSPPPSIPFLIIRIPFAIFEAGPPHFASLLSFPFTSDVESTLFSLAWRLPFCKLACFLTGSEPASCLYFLFIAPPLRASHAY